MALSTQRGPLFWIRVFFTVDAHLISPPLPSPGPPESSTPSTQVPEAAVRIPLPLDHPPAVPP
eukprot:9262329-Pyramimonas_sp.AAC.1